MNLFLKILEDGTPCVIQTWNTSNEYDSNDNNDLIQHEDGHNYNDKRLIKSEIDHNNNIREDNIIDEDNNNIIEDNTDVSEDIENNSIINSSQNEVD